MKQFILIITVIVSFSSLNVLAAEKTLKILAIYAQARTSIQQYVAAEDLRGVVLAVDEINSNGGLLGHTLEVIDARSISVIDAMEKTMTYIKQDDLIAVVGANISNFTLKIAPVYQENKIPIISPISTNPQVTLIGDFVFRTCFTDPFQGKVMARYAIDDLNAKTAVIITKVSSKFSVGLSDHFQKEFQKNGTILYQGSYLVEDVDFSTTLNHVKKLNPDVIFVPGHGRDSGLIVKQAHTMGIKSTFIGGDGWGKGVLGVAGNEAVEGHAFSNHWHRNVDTPESKKFVNSYHKKYETGLIAASAALAYDATMLIANAAEEAGSIDRIKIRNALSKTKNFKGITGTYTFDKNGDPINKDAVILKYQNGEIVYVKTIKP